MYVRFRNLPTSMAVSRSLFRAPAFRASAASKLTSWVLNRMNLSLSETDILSRVYLSVNSAITIVGVNPLPNSM